MHYTHLHNEEVWGSHQGSHQGRWDFTQPDQKHSLVMRKIFNKVLYEEIYLAGWSGR